MATNVTISVLFKPIHRLLLFAIHDDYLNRGLSIHVVCPRAVSNVREAALILTVHGTACHAAGQAGVFQARALRDWISDNPKRVPKVTQHSYLQMVNIHECLGKQSQCMPKVTLMQFSDLHKSASVYNTNKSLVSSLMSDMKRHSKEPIVVPRPEILIVCGDIVQGSESSEKEVESQYEEAMDLLELLCEKVFDGDRSRVVIVPGNHDVARWLVPEMVKNGFTQIF
jgi:hypothetical protein